MEEFGHNEPMREENFNISPSLSEDNQESAEHHQHHHHHQQHHQHHQHHSDGKEHHHHHHHKENSEDRERNRRLSAKERRKRMKRILFAIMFTIAVAIMCYTIYIYIIDPDGKAHLQELKNY